MMNEDDMYRYLDNMQAKRIKHVRMKQNIGEEYLNRTKSILKIKLNGKYAIRTINTCANTVLIISFGIVKWTPTDLENLKTKMIPLLTRYRFYHTRATKERFALSCKTGGRDFIDVTRLHTYFLNKEVNSSLYAAVVSVDDRCTPMDLVRANVNELHTDEEYNNKVKRQWSHKALHGRHAYDLNQQCLNIQASK